MDNYQLVSENESLVVDNAENGVLENTENKLIENIKSGKANKYFRFTLAVLGSIPWVGSLISASAGLSAEFEQDKVNQLNELWLKEHQEKIKDLNMTLQDIFTRLDGFGDEVQERIESPEYLNLVRKTFRSWDESDTQEKREMLKKLITNAAAINLCPDDLVRLFISWINQYHESHFSVIKEIFQQPMITRGEIWNKIHPDGRPREDSAEADLYKYLIGDLSMGRVIRQSRETNGYGQFIKRGTTKSKYSSTVMKSAFDETESYELTELGKQFVHYVMNDVVTQLKDQI